MRPPVRVPTRVVAELLGQTYSTRKPSSLPNRHSQYVATAYNQNLQKGVREFFNVIPTPVLKKGAVKVVIYFDEAHELSNHQVGPDQKNRLEVLYSCLDVFLAFPLIFIFTSTTSSLQRLAFPPAMASSARRAPGNFTDQAPITELPFDCHHSFPLKPDEYSFQDICKLKSVTYQVRGIVWTNRRILSLVSAHCCRKAKSP
ncbi:hypothetical protein JOM56_011539 [Amanita muscaria]